MYKQNRDDIEYIAKLRSDNKDTLVQKVTRASSMILMCSIPADVEQQVQNTLGEDWFKDSKKVAQFMRENPQYAMAKPL